MTVFAPDLAEAARFLEAHLRADSAGRAAFYSTMVANGIMSRNEARAKENLNRVDGENMDAYTAQSNMLALDKLGQPTPQKAAADSRIVIMGNEGASEIGERLQRIEQVAKWPRKLVMDEKGEPVGSVPVERL
jgi:hypothetical protein